MNEINDWNEIHAAQLPVFGASGLRRLRRSRVHIAGLGGIGFSTALNLAAAGVGIITANDPQTVSADNLNRFPFATPEHIGIPKATFLDRLLRGRPGLKVITSMQRNEESGFDQFCQKADLIVSCANTVESRVAAAREALQNRRPLIDISLADARIAMAGFIKLWLPQNEGWSACPACYFGDNTRVLRGEGIVGTVAAGLAAFAACMVLQLLTGHKAVVFYERNFFIIEFSKPQVESMAVVGKKGCIVCGDAHSSEKLKCLRRSQDAGSSSRKQTRTFCSP